MFEPSEVATSCTPFTAIGQTCKRQCIGDDCNDGGLERHQCQSCHVTFDHMGNYISGHETCFTDPEGHLADCPTGTSHCAVEMVADWTMQGKMEYSFTRRCADEDDRDDFREQQDIDGDFTDKNDFTVKKIGVQGNSLFPVHFRSRASGSCFFSL